MSLMPDYWFARVFFDADKAGSTADVYLLDSAISLQSMQAIASRSDCDASCFCLSGERAGIYKVDTFNCQQRIQTCGHGLLASAAVILEHNYDDNFSSRSLVLQTTQESIAVKREKDFIWIGFESLPLGCSESDEESLQVAACFSVAPEKMTRVGGDSSYWVIEWRPDVDLAKLSVNFKALIVSTRRSIIATQKNSRSSDDFNLRYFAPQYGTDEDKATGSACRVLTSYWQQQRDPQVDSEQQFHAHQLSSTGATMACKIQLEKVWISGNIALERENISSQSSALATLKKQR
ncbi:MAG: PhzF family phenazine biosynthesis protein [Oceanicoccus sp.]|jgi:PhzF family phenazine biosynthesis protein